MKRPLVGLLAVALTMTGVLARPAAGAAASSSVVIGMSRVQYDSPGDDEPVTNSKLNAEYVVIKNYSSTAYNLSGWTLRDRSSHIFTFPSYGLAGGASVTVHTGSGTNSSGNLYQDSDNYIWNNDGDTAYLRAFNNAAIGACSWGDTGSGSTSCPASTAPAPPRAARDDFNGDGRTDVGVFRPSNGTWYIHGVETVVYGKSGDVPVPADYTGDGKADVAVFRPSNGTWYIRGVETVAFGKAGDIPVPGDYNGDGKADLTVFRPSTGTWYIRGVETVSFGRSGDVPVAREYNGDRKTDVAVFRPSNGTWYVRGVETVTYGKSGDIPVPGDYNGDGKTDLAVFRPSTGTWYVDGVETVAFGASGDRPVAGDYNADGKTDIAVYRPSTGTWYVRGVETVAYGANTDIPV